MSHSIAVSERQHSRPPRKTPARRRQQSALFALAAAVMLSDYAGAGVPAEQDVQVYSRAVSYADLDLQLPPQIDILLERVRSASQQVCRDAHRIVYARARRSKCSRTTYASAVEELRRRGVIGGLDAGPALAGTAARAGAVPIGPSRPPER